jgi:uncharacterized coiled-coil DUF342 family protein
MCNHCSCWFFEGHCCFCHDVKDLRGIKTEAKRGEEERGKLLAKIDRLRAENDELEAENDELKGCPNESWECAKEIRLLTKERDSLRENLDMALEALIHSTQKHEYCALIEEAIEKIRGEKC